MDDPHGRQLPHHPGPAVPASRANRTIVMDAGQVQAAGSHAELAAASLLYGELAAICHRRS